MTPIIHSPYHSGHSGMHIPPALHLADVAKGVLRGTESGELSREARQAYQEQARPQPTPPRKLTKAQLRAKLAREGRARARQ